MGYATTDRLTSGNWAKVDGAADPDAFVGYLDAVSASADAQAYKRQTYDFLEPHPGARILDVGCGTGDDARALARLVAPTGQVVGIDVSAAMIEESRRRSGDLGPALEFRVGDVHCLDFPDATFDGARADRVLQHLADPERALSELIRVTKPGGRIVVVDPDWGTLTIDRSDRATTRAVTDEIAGAIRNPWMGRQLFGLFHRAGLTRVTFAAGNGVYTNYAQADHLFHISEGLEQAKKSGAVTQEAATDWLRGLQAAGEAGRFFSSLTAIIVAGCRPGHQQESGQPYRSNRSQRAMP